MKAIILAAGKGTRLQPLTLNIPKAMVEVYGKPLLEHNINKLFPFVDEFIIVVKYKKEVIIEYFWDEYQWKKIHYHEQGGKQGTAWALEWIHISWDCFIISSDSIYHQQDINMIATYDGYAALCQEVENPEKWGIFQISPHDHTIEKVIEKPRTYVWNLAHLFYLKVNSKMVHLCEWVEVSPRWEYELTDAINTFVQDFPLRPLILQKSFIDVTTHQDLEKANTIKKPPLWHTRYIENIGSYEVHVWIPQNGIQEILSYSQDTRDIALQKWTSDGKKRFTSHENISKWYHDTNRYPFTLLSEDGTVAGLWWGRPAKMPIIHEVLNNYLYKMVKDHSDNIHTSAIRIYPFARGKKLASPFMEVCERCYKQIFTDIYMCDDISETNLPSQKAFERLGYKKVWYGKNINNSLSWGEKRFVYAKKW